MAALSYRRRIATVVIARDGDEARVTLDGVEVARALLPRASQLHLLPGSLIVPIDPALLQPTAIDPIETIAQVAIEVREPRWTGLEWERCIRTPLPCAVIRRSHVRPRVLDVPFTVPARVLYVGGRAPQPDFVAGAFGSHDSSVAALSAHCELSMAERTVEKLEWPTVEILHFRDLENRARGIPLLSTSVAESAGTVGWIGRHAQFWQTRLILIETRDIMRTPMLRAADLIVGRGGPAVWVVPENAPWLPLLYAYLFHDRPLDWIQRELQREPGDARLFAGAGREEALRFSAIGVALTRRRNVQAIDVAARRAASSARQKRIEDLIDDVIRRTLQAQGVPIRGGVIPSHMRIDIPMMLDVAREYVPQPDALRMKLPLLRQAQRQSVADVRVALSAALKYPLAMSGGTRLARTLTTRAYRQVAGPRKVQLQLANMRRLMSRVQFEDHESEGTLPLARAVNQLRIATRAQAGASAAAPAPATPATVVAPPERHVNSGFFRMNDVGALISVPAATPLARNEVVHFGIQIGSRKKDFGRTIGPTALVEEVFRWTLDSLGAGLEIGVTPLDFELLGPAVQELWLPARDETDRITFALRPRAQTAIAGVARLRFTIYYRNNILYSFRAAALLEGTDGETAPRLARALGVRAADVEGVAHLTRTEYSVGAKLDQLSNVPRRGLAIVANDSGGQKVATFKADDFFAVTVDNNIGPLVENARLALKDAATRSDLYLYGSDNAGTPERLKETLYNIAAHGWALYTTLLPDEHDRGVLELHMLEQDVIHAAHMDLTKVAPWSLVYDREIDPEHKVEYENPNDPNGKKYDVERALCTATLPGPDGRIPAIECRVDPRCPLSPQQNDKLKQQGRIHCTDSVVCPAHFWGFRHNIELPVQQQTGRDERKSAQPAALRTAIQASVPTGVVAAFNRNLPLASTHEKNLRAAIGAVTPQALLRDPIYYERDQVKQALNALQADVVYFYCHAEAATPGKDGATVASRLNFGDLEKLDQTLTAANLTGKSWSNSPLVFLNGCATVGFSPVAPSELIRRFVQGRKAAAVIGAEVTTWELLADAVAVYFLEAFLAGVPAGEALLSARRRLLAKHNPLGLAYSLYGSADLHLEKPK
jgi:hypothetical protein